MSAAEWILFAVALINCLWAIPAWHLGRAKGITETVRAWDKSSKDWARLCHDIIDAKWEKA